MLSLHSVQFQDRFDVTSNRLHTSLHVTIKWACFTMIPYSARSFYANLPEIRNIPEVISHLILKLDRVYRSVSEIKVVTYMYTYMSQVTCKHYIVQNTWCWWDFLQFINSIIIWYFKWPLFYTSIDLRGIWLQFISSGAGHILYIMMNNCLQCFITFMNKGACS